MRRPTSRQTAALGSTIAVLLAVAVLAALLGPHPGYLMHRLVPFGSGTSASVGRHYRADEENVGLPLGTTAECVESSSRRRCDYIVRLRQPGGRVGVSEPMLWMERTRGGPDVSDIEVVAASAVPPGLTTARLLPTQRRDVVALAADADRDADGWYPVRAAWQADTRHWRLRRIDPAPVRAYDPNRRPTGPLPPRPQLYRAVAEGPVQDPPDIKRPSIAPVMTDWRTHGFRIDHLYDLSEGKDVLVTARNATVGVTDVDAVPHVADVKLVYGLVANGKPRRDLVGLLSNTPSGAPDAVQYAWRVTVAGTLEAIPIDGLTCQRIPPYKVGAGLCAPNYDNLVALRGAP